MAHTYIIWTMATDDEDLNYLEKYGHRACFVLEIDVCNWVAILFRPVKWAIFWRRHKMDFLDIYCLFFGSFFNGVWFVSMRQAITQTGSDPIYLFIYASPGLSELKDMSAKHGRYTSLDSKQTSQWNAANMPTPQLPMHRVLCSLVHSHSFTHLNYWNMCRLGCAIMLFATLLAPTRYETVSKHHAATNVTIITYMKEIVKYWENWEIPRKIRKYRSNSWWNIFRVAGLLCGEFTGDRWIPRTKASDAELWCYL